MSIDDEWMYCSNTYFGEFVENVTEDGEVVIKTDSNLFWVLDHLNSRVSPDFSSKNKALAWYESRFQEMKDD